MAKFDTDEVLKLLQIPSMVAGTAPGMNHISSEAMARLREIDEGPRLDSLRTPGPDDPAPGMPADTAIPSAPVEPPKSKVAELAAEAREADASAQHNDNVYETEPRRI